MASYPQNGITLKALLEIPFVMNPPQIQQNPNKVKDVDEEYDPFSGQSAFLGPNLWDHTLPYDANNLKLEYMDLDEFLQENGIPVAPDQGAFQLPQPNQPQIQNSPNPNHLPIPQNPNQLPSQALLQQLRQQLQQQQQLQQMRGNISPHHLQQAEQQPQQLHQPQLQQLQQLQQQRQQHQQLRSNISPQQQKQQEPQHSPKQSQKMPALLSMKDIHPPVPPTSEAKTPKQPPTPTIPVPVPVAPHSDGHVKQEDDGTSTCSNCSLPELISPSPPQKSPTSVKSPPPASDPPSSGPPSAVSTPSQEEGDGDDSGDETETESMTDDGAGEDGGQEDFDPKKRVFNDDDLRPQPMIKKSKKVFVPEEMKDTKYWMRRRKNNLAAKRSRDARRTKENQIIMRAAYLEHENDALHVQVEKMEKENRELRKKLSKYESSDSSS